MSDLARTAPARPTRRQMKRFYPRADLKTRIVALPQVGLV